MSRARLRVYGLGGLNQHCQSFFVEWVCITISVLMGVMLLLLVAPVAAEEDTTLAQFEDTNIVQYVATEPDFCCPAVNPVTVNLVVNGCRYVVSLPVLVGIGISLGETWDGINEHLHNFTTGLSNKLNNLLSANKWIYATSNEFAAMLDFECLVSSEYGNGRQDNKWYHIAKWTPEGIIINPMRISEETAAKVMKWGGNIFTTTEERARNCVNRISKIQVNQTNIEIHGLREDGYFEHYHPKKTHKIHYPQHCWFWMR